MKGPQVIGILIHIIAVLTVWGLFSLPVIFYYHTKEGDSIEYLSELNNFIESLRASRFCLPNNNISFNEDINFELCQGVFNLNLSVNVPMVYI